MLRMHRTATARTLHLHGKLTPKEGRAVFTAVCSCRRWSFGVRLGAFQ